MDNIRDILNEYSLSEFDEEFDFNNVNEDGTFPILYTVYWNNDEIDLQVNADLNNYRLLYYVNNNLVITENYDTEKNMCYCLKGIQFDILFTVFNDYID